MTPSQTSCTEEKSLQITMMFKQCVVDPQQKRGVCIYTYIYMYVCIYYMFFHDPWEVFFEFDLHQVEWFDQITSILGTLLETNSTVRP